MNQNDLDDIDINELIVQDIEKQKLALPDTLLSLTYELQLPDGQNNFVKVFLVVCEYNGKPVRIFFSTKCKELFESLSALSELVNRQLEYRVPVNTVIGDLISLLGATTGHYMKGGRYCNSINAHIAYIMQDHIAANGIEGLRERILQQPIKTRK